MRIARRMLLLTLTILCGSTLFANAEELNTLLDRSSEHGRYGRWEQALADCDAARQIDQRAFEPQLCRAHALLFLERYDDARAAVAALGLADLAGVVPVVSDIYSRHGDIEQAIEVSRFCVDKVKSSEPLCWNQLVWLLLLQGKEQEAVAYAVRGFEVLKDPEARSSLGQVVTNTAVSEADMKRLLAALGPAAPPRLTPRSVPRVVMPNRITKLKLHPLKGWFTTKVKLNGRSLEMIVDTGASSVTLRSEVAKRLGLEPSGTVTTLEAGATAPTQRGSVMVNRFEIGNVRFENLEVGVETDPVFPSDGVLGTGILQDACLDLDLHEHRLQLSPSPCRLPQGAATTPILVVSHSILVPGSIADSLDGWFLIDSGADTDFFNMQQLPRLAKRGVTSISTPKGAPPPAAYGGGGRTEGTYTSAFSARFAGIPIEHPVPRFVPADFDIGVLLLGAWGNPTLRQFRVLIDYRRRVLALVPAGRDARVSLRDRVRIARVPSLVGIGD